MTEARRLEVGIVDNFSRPAQKIAGAAASIDKRAQAMGRALAAAADKGLDKTTTAALRANNALLQFKRSAGGASTAIAALGLTVGARQVLDYADAWTNLGNRVKLFTKNGAEAVVVQEQLFRLAQRTRAPLASTGELYQRLAQGTKGLNLSQSDLLGVLKTINQTLVISGTSSAGASAALVQLGQGFASGTLRGEELNSVLEQAPRLAQLFADGLGVPLGKLRELGAAGELSVGKLLNALRTEGGQVAKEFDQTSTTIGQSFQKIEDSVIRITGVVEAAFGPFAALAGLLGETADALSNIGTAEIFEDYVKGVSGATVGASGGAFIGAGLGSLVPGVGTAIGAGVGAGVGALGLGSVGYGVGVGESRGARAARNLRNDDSGRDQDGFEGRAAAVAAVSQILAKSAGDAANQIAPSGKTFFREAGVGLAQVFDGFAGDLEKIFPQFEKALPAVAGVSVSGIARTTTATGAPTGFKGRAAGKGATAEQTILDKLAREEAELAGKRREQARALEALGTIAGRVNPAFRDLASSIGSFITGDPIGGVVSGFIALEGILGSSESAQEKYRRKLQETNRALENAAAAVERFGTTTSQELTEADLRGTVGAFNTLTGFGAGNDRSLKNVVTGGANALGQSGTEALAREFGLSTKEFIRQVEEAVAFFPDIDPTKKGSFDAIAQIAETAGEQLARFGELDTSTFGGARADFSFQRSIARPGSDLASIFESSFGDLVKSFNTSDLSFVLEEGVALSSAQTRTLKELLAELRDFHTDATQENTIVERLVRERFRGEELAVRGKFAGRFAAADGDPAETNNLLRQMARELDALATEEKAFVRAVSRGDLGATLGTGLDAVSGAAKSGASASSSGNPVADLIDFDSIEPAQIPVNDVLRITGRVSFLRWDQALNFDDAEPSRASWPETVVLEAASNLRHTPPDGFGSIVDVGPGTPPIDVSWPKVIRPFVDPSQRWAPGDYGTLVKIDSSTPPILRAWPTAVAFEPAPGERHSVGAYGDLVSLEGATLLRRAWADAIEFATYNRRILPTWADAAEVTAETPAIARAWSTAVELHPWAKQALPTWADAAQVGSDVPQIARAWPDAVALSYGAGTRHTPGFWGAIATIPGDTTRLARTWPAAVSLSAGGLDRHNLGYWGNAAFIPSDTTRLGRSWAAAVSLSAGGSERHTPGFWGQIATIPGDTAKLTRIWPSIVSLLSSAESRLTPGSWGVLADIPSTTAKLGRMWPTTVELFPATSLRATPGTWGTLVDIPSTTAKLGRMWPTTVQMFNGGGRHTLNHWADAVDIAQETSRLYRFWNQTVQMTAGPNFLKHTPGSWADLVYMPPNLGGRLQIAPVDFAEVVGEPVPVDVNQLFTPVGQLQVPAEAVAAPPSDPYSGSSLSPFQIDASNGGGDIFSSQWQN